MKSPFLKFRAFTLIELLVVIGVILILAALAMPAMNSARQKALMAKGLGNLKQLTSAAIALTVENEGRWWWSKEEMVEPAGQQGEENGQAKVAWYQGISDFLESKPPEAGTTPLAKILVDPTAPREQPVNFAPLSIFFGETISPEETDAASVSRRSANRLITITRPGVQIFLADVRGDGRIVQSYGNGGSPSSWGAPTEESANWSHPETYGANDGEIDFKRGGGKAKVSFLDGHVEIVTPKTLTQRMVDPACNRQL